MKIKNKKTGFTMIELLIVIVIMGILSAIGLGTFRSSQLKARDSKRKSDLRTIGDALEVYYNDFGHYPLDGNSGGHNGIIMGCGTNALGACSAGVIWQNSTNQTTYMVQMPQDPRAGIYYYMSATGADYKIYAHLENDKDKDIPKNALGESMHYILPENETGLSACATGDCNYGRSSTNVSLGAVN